MSFEALAWCNELLDADPADDGVDLSAGAVNVLRILCEDAWKDRDYESLIKSETLERRTRMSWDSISRALKTLEALDLVYVTRRRAGDGTRRSNTYIVLFNERARLHAAALGWGGFERSEKRTDEAAQQVSHSAICGVDHSANEGSATPQIAENHSAICGVAPYISRIDSLTPPVTGARGAREGREEELSEKSNRTSGRTNERDAERVERWKRFSQIWPWRVNELPGEVREVFLALGDADQQAAIDAAPRYWAESRTGGVKNPWQARRWLLGEGWKTLKARAPESAAALGGAPFFARIGTAQWFRWEEYYRAAGGASMRRDAEGVLRLVAMQTRGGMGRTFPAEWPPPLPESSRLARDGPPDDAVA